MMAPLGPVDEIVSKDNPLYRSNSLDGWLFMTQVHYLHGLRSVLLQLIRTLTFR
jgi:hypothetical protein